MSGGSMNYLYSKVLHQSDFPLDTPEREAFAAHLKLVAQALHDIEWVDSGDYGPGDENAAIRACLRPEQPKAEPNVEYERGFIDGMQMQTKSSVDRAVNRMAEPVASLNAWAADRLARHGIQACLYPQCVGGQSGTVCHKHCPTPCPDCRGLGYDASGQLCACQQNPSF